MHESLGVFDHYIAECLDRSQARTRLAPDRADLSVRRRFDQGANDDAARVAISAATGKLRHERYTGAGRDHLAQRFEAGGPKVLALMDGDAATYLQGLVAQAVTFLQQQQALVLKVRDTHRGRLSQSMMFGPVCGPFATANTAAKTIA